MEGNDVGGNDPLIVFDVAVRISDGTPFGLSSGVRTNRQNAITHFVNELQRARSTWDVLGYWIELTPFGVIKNSGPGYKKGRSGSIEGLHQSEALFITVGVREWH